MNVQAKVLKRSEPTTNGNIIHTLGIKKTAMIAGIKKETVNKYCIAMPEAIKDDEFELDMSLFNIVTQENVDDDGAVLHSNWLFLK